jgi:hypothetical protein
MALVSLVIRDSPFNCIHAVAFSFLGAANIFFLSNLWVEYVVRQITSAYVGATSQGLMRKSETKAGNSQKAISIGFEPAYARHNPALGILFVFKMIH